MKVPPFFSRLMPVLSLAAAIVGMTLLCTSCRNDGGGGSSSRRTLTVLVSGGEADVRFVKEQTAQFQTFNPRTTIRVILLPVQKPLAEAIGGEARRGSADVLLFNARHASNLQREGLLLRLPNNGKLKPVLEDIAPKLNAFPACVPFSWSPLMLYYNPKLFDRGSISYPNDFWSWSDLADATQTLTRRDEARPDQSVLALEIPGQPDDILPVLLQFEGGFYNAKEGRVAVGVAEKLSANEDALGLYAELITKYRVARQVSGDQPAGSLFLNGRAAMRIGPFSLLPTLRKAGAVPFNVAPLPRGKTRATLLDVQALAILKASPSRDEALGLILFLMRPEAQEKLAEAGVGLPTRASVLGEDSFWEGPPFAGLERPRYFLESLHHGFTLPASPDWPLTEAIMAEELGKAMAGRQLPLETLIEIQKKTGGPARRLVPD